ncbi:MAG: hypothetical protein JWL63_3615 [Rhodocyclales bacterium]|nr:hypothetical protein [Rhodocyclales bacterium]
MGRVAELQASGKFVSALAVTDSTIKLYGLTMRQPVRAYMLAFQQELAGGHADSIPAWLREGSANLVANAVMDQLHLEIGTWVWRAGDDAAIRAVKESIDSAAMLSSAVHREKSANFLPVADMMVEYLKGTMGDRFYPALAGYFRAAAAPGFQADAAFQANFGMSMDAFMQGAVAQLTRIRVEVRQHNRAVPLALEGTDISDSSRFPLEEESARKALEQYRLKRSPKALALSTRGSWAYASDQADAMDQALEVCRISDAVSCQLYAVDNTIVYQAALKDAAGIEAIMIDSRHDIWSQRVAETWLPVVKQSVDNFNRLLKDHLGGALNDSVRIYVTANIDDYETILHKEMKVFAAEAADGAHLSAGISDSRGQIALVFPMDLDPSRLVERATRVPLHELTHEVQGQLSKRYRGFKPSKWIQEGTANYFAFNIVKDLPVQGASQFSPDTWRRECIAWYKDGGWHVSPEDAFTTSDTEWVKMMSYRKGPYEMAGLMTMHLASVLGERFYPAWVKYFTLAGQRGQQEPEAFQQSFGMSKAEYLASLDRWLKTL